jgi:hypothetical protein
MLLTYWWGWHVGLRLLPSSMWRKPQIWCFTIIWLPYHVYAKEKKREGKKRGEEERIQNFLDAWLSFTLQSTSPSMRPGTATDTFFHPLIYGSLSAYRFAFDWDDDGFTCSNTMGISTLSLSLSHDYHHLDSLQLANGKDGTKQHFWDGIEEAYYAVKEMLFVSVFPSRRFGANDDDVLWWCHWWRHGIFFVGVP